VKHAVVTWLGLVLFFSAAGAVLCVDIGRELLSSRPRSPRWIGVLAYVVVPILLVAAAAATLVRIFTLA
jgi:hypothetical protein